MADKREFLVVIDGRESVSPAAGKASDSLGKLGDKAKSTERDFDGLDQKLRAHADTIGHLRAEIAKTGDTKLFGELGRQEREFSKLAGLRKSLTKAAEDAAPEMSVSLMGRLGPLLARLPLSGPMGVGLAAAAAAAAPSVGAIIAGSIVGGASIGGVVGGAILASKDPRVKTAFGDLGDEIGADLRDAARPFVPAMLEAAKRVRSGFQPIKNDLKAIFAESSKFVAPLTEAAIRATSRITNGLRDLIEGAGGPAIQAIGDGLEGVGDAIGDVLESLSDNGPEAAQAMTDLFDVIEGGVRVAGYLVNGLTEVYKWLTLARIGFTGDTDALVRYIEAHRKGTSVGEQFADMLKQEGNAAYTTAQMVDLLTAALDRQADDALSAAEAHLAYRESLAQAKETIDGKIGANLREERALLNLARATNAQTRAMDTSNKSAEQIKDQYDEATAAFINTAVKMGYTRQAAARLADQLLKMPKAIATDVIVNTSRAHAGVRNIQKAINNVRGKTVYVNVIRTGEYGANDQGAMHGGVRAAGGPVKAGVMYTVGEQGRETFIAPKDGYIINNRDTAMLHAGGGRSTPSFGGGITIQNVNLPGVRDAQQFVRELRNLIRIQFGGNVQSALGG